MKNSFKKIFIIFIIASIVFSINFVSRAEDEDSEQSQDLPNQIFEEKDSEYDDDDLWDIDSEALNFSKNHFEFSAKDVNIDEDVHGDVFVCSSGTVTINSYIYGNVFIAANNIVINEDAGIESSLFAVSQSLKILGSIEKNVYVASQNFTLDNNAYLGLDLFLTSGNINFNGYLDRDAFISCDTSEFSEEPTILGDLNYSATEEATIPEGVVSGNVNYSKITNNEKASTFSLKPWIYSCISFIVLAIVVFLISTKLAPHFVEKSLTLPQNIGKYILFGLLALIVTPIVSIILLALEVTATVSVILILAYIALILISSSIFINSISVLASNRFKEKINTSDTLRQIIFIVLFAIIYKALKLIPVLGGILTFAVNLIGAGILVKNILPEKTTNTEIN